MGRAVEPIAWLQGTGKSVGGKEGESEGRRGCWERNRPNRTDGQDTGSHAEQQQTTASEKSVMRLVCGAWELAMRPSCCHTMWINTSCSYVALSCHAVEQGITASCCHTKAPQCYAVIRGTMATAPPGMRLLDTEWLVESAD